MNEGISRRDFLKNAALITGGATFATGMSACAPTDQSTQNANGDPLDTTAIQVGKRPEPNSGGGPLPMQTGKIGPDAEPILPLEAPVAWDAEYDIVVVGSGYGGLTAALYGAQAGASVALLDKSSVTGGASRHSTVNAIIPGGSKEQEKLGYSWPGDHYDPKEAASRYQRYYNYSVDNELLLATITSGAEWADWMCAQPGVEWVCQGPVYIDVDIAEGRQSLVLGNSKTCDALESDAREAGVEIMLLTECAALVQQDGRVIGVKAININSDTELFLKADKGVILTAGGIGYNLDLLEQYAPSAYMYAVQGGPFPSHTGDCFRMGIGVGGDVSGYNSFSCWEGGLDEYWGLGDGEYWHYFWNGAKQLIQNPWLIIDKAGNRLPYYIHDLHGGEILQPGYDLETFSMGDLSSAAAWMASIGHRGYTIFDSNYASSLAEHEKTVLAFDASRVVLKDDGKLIENSFVTTDWEREFQDAVDRGAISKADTLEELAETLGLEPERLTAAVEHWNELCTQGEDTDLAIPYLPEWLIPLDNPPYYGAAQGGVIGKMLVGLRVNGNMQVIRPTGDVIPGLYAGWHTAGGICGENSFGAQFGNASIFGGAAISGVGGLMAIKGLLESED